MDLINLPEFIDPSGNLSVAEFPGLLPFPPRRFFLIYGVPEGSVRGNHAHKELHQFVICTRGSCIVSLADGQHQWEFVLDTPTKGLYLPPMVWAAQSHFTPDAVLLVLASDIYKPKDYIHDYDEFLMMVNKE